MLPRRTLPLYYINPSALLPQDGDEREHTIIVADRKSTPEAIISYLNEKEENADWFDCQKAENDYEYYDCVLKYLDVYTDYVYTFCVQDDVIKVYDNTRDQDADVIRKKISEFRNCYQEESIAAQQREEKEGFIETVDGTVDSIKQYIMFNSADDCFYSALQYVATDPAGLHFADTLFYPIK